MRENNPAGRTRHAFEIYFFDPLTLESFCWNVYVQNKETKKKKTYFKTWNASSHPFQLFGFYRT